MNLHLSNEVWNVYRSSGYVRKIETERKKTEHHNALRRMHTIFMIWCFFFLVCFHYVSKMNSSNTPTLGAHFMFVYLYTKNKINERYRSNSITEQRMSGHWVELDAWCRWISFLKLHTLMKLHVRCSKKNEIRFEDIN